MLEVCYGKCFLSLASLSAKVHASLLNIRLAWKKHDRENTLAYFVLPLKWQKYARVCAGGKCFLSLA